MQMQPPVLERHTATIPSRWQSWHVQTTTLNMVLVTLPTDDIIPSSVESTTSAARWDLALAPPPKPVQRPRARVGGGGGGAECANASCSTRHVAPTRRCRAAAEASTDDRAAAAMAPGADAAAAGASDSCFRRLLQNTAHLALRTAAKSIQPSTQNTLVPTAAIPQAIFEPSRSRRHNAIVSGSPVLQVCRWKTMTYLKSKP